MGCSASKNAYEYDIGTTATPARLSRRPSQARQQPPLVNPPPLPPPAVSRIPKPTAPGRSRRSTRRPRGSSDDDLSDRLTKTVARPARVGVFSDVWLGKLAPQGITVAIKSLRTVTIEHSPLVRERIDRHLRRQTKLWTSIRHQRIVNCLGYATIDGMPCIIMLWYSNGNIGEFLASNPRANRRALVLQIAEGLAYLHDNGIVHGDVKAPNVLISDHGEAMVTDFGLAKILEETRTGLTTSNTTALSIRYSAPEVLEGQNANASSDVYSFGCLALEIMTGKGPFYDIKSPTAVVAAKFRGATPITDHFPELPRRDPMWALLKWCWSQNHMDRPTMSQVVLELSRPGPGPSSQFR